MNLGYEINRRLLLDDQDIHILIEVGFNQGWVNSSNTGVDVVFSGKDKEVYSYLLRHYKRYRKIPDLSIFRENYPDSVYPLPPLTPPSPSLEEIIDLAQDKVKSFLVATLIGSVIDLHDRGRIDQAVSLIKSESDRLSQDLRSRQYRADNLADAEFDIEAFLHREFTMGIPFGIKPIDEEFYGFQPGQLVALLGRQKAGKTFFTLNSALNAWREGYRVLFFSVEMDTDALRDRFYAMGAGVSLSRLRRGRLHDPEVKKIRLFHEDIVNDDVGFIISKKRSLITVDDIRDEIAIHNPNAIFIDGFNFMVDRHTKKTTYDWQANENVANELKAIALEEGIVVFVNTQVQEKQYNRKHGIEASTMAGGTGLLKAPDLVIGLDKDGSEHTVSCVLSRHEYFDEQVVVVDWETMNFEYFDSPDMEGI